MQLRRLRLENFRNIARLDLELPPGRIVLVGENAQGKTNILEAISMFATAKSVRAEHERDLIAWDSLEEPVPFARIAGAIERARDSLRLEIVLQLGSPEPGDGARTGEGRPLLKRVRVNGAPRRASELVGEVQAVLFEPQDIELVYGPPTLRRRHLDLTLAQVNRALLRELQHYARVLEQRNRLLKNIREQRTSLDELTFWDQELVQAGAFIIHARRQAIAEINSRARPIYRELTGGREQLQLAYHPALEAPLGTGPQDIAAAFQRALAAVREREVLQGASLVGPHRDNLAFEVNGADLAAFGSRGQQRLATLSLKLAEAQYMHARTGDRPLLLLDDVLSELDRSRRGYLLRAVAQYGQSVLTTTDLDSLDQDFRSAACVLQVAGGSVAQPTMAQPQGSRDG